MFGSHRTPVSISKDGLSITLKRVDEFFFYRRESSDGIVEKVLLEAPEEIILDPVEPLNTPSRITPHLLIGFSKAVVARPHSTRTIFLKFPVEIGVILSGGDKDDVLDVISLPHKKFTLYGTPRGGHVCRFWQSDVFAAAPETDPLYEGVLGLDIRNESDEWVTVNRVVFDVHGMKIYYKKNLVSARGKMTVISERTAETEFIDSPLAKGMKRAIELFKEGRLAVSSSRFHMGEGL
ncbi:MAG TPA: DUF432 domain-containing protein [Acidobacteriota bacterium]|nr:DUF432 domain-containing protein [Acidobacteriota bacterium]